ncbi:MAG: PAS domain-containing protein, partial [Devosia sp.]
MADNYDGMVVIDEGETVVAASRVGRQLLEAAAGAIDGRPAAAVLPPEMLVSVRRAFEAGRTVETQALAVAVLRQGTGDESRRVVQYATTVSDVGGGRVACVNFWDVTERRRAEEKLNFLAMHDPLTGALSRTGFCAALNERFVSDRMRAEGITVMAIDLAR